MDTGSKVENQFWQVHQGMPRRKETNCKVISRQSLTLSILWRHPSGSETELLYQLLEHGIASQNLPDMNNFDETASAKHRQWLHRMTNVALEL